MKLMKRIICIVFALCLTLPFAACGGGDAELNTPSWVDMDADYVFSWEEIDLARSYEVGVTALGGGEENVIVTRRTSYSLSELAEGDYNVRVRAVGGRNNNQFSEWTEGYEFHRDHESGLLYSLINNNSEYAVLRVGTATGDVPIEDYYRGKPVTAIADAAFRTAGERIKSVTIGKNVKTIGESAFNNCTGLKSIELPDCVVSIGASVFQNCTALESVSLSPAITLIPQYAFAHCTSLREIEIGNTVTSIGESAFTTCASLTTVDLPDSVVFVDDYAFNEDDALTEVTFGENIQSIGAYAFYSCDVLTSLQFPEQLAEGLSLTIGDYAFANCDSLKQVKLCEGTNDLGTGCFSYSDQLEAVSIPESVTSVGAYAFLLSGLYNEQVAQKQKFIYAGDWLLSISDEYFSEIEILDNREIYADTIGIADYAFIKQDPENGNNYVGCTNLRKIDLPASVKHIGEFAFYNSLRLNELFAQRNGLQTIGTGAFEGCQALSNVRFSDGLLTIGESAFKDCTILYSNADEPRLLIPRTVTQVGVEAFKDAGLWSVTDEYGVIYAGNWVVGYVGTGTTVNLRSGDIDGIADMAFSQAEQVTSDMFGAMVCNSNLQSISGLGRVRNIGAGAFIYCNSLAAVSLNANVHTIGVLTFAYCSSLRRVTMPTTLTSIGAYAFFKCGGLRSLDLSDTKVDTIGSRAFYGCSSLSEIDLGPSIQTIESRAFYGCRSLPEVTIPGTVKEIGVQAFAKCTSLNSLTLEDGIERIGQSAFRESSILDGVHIPDSVKVIDDYAFYGVMTSGLDLGNGVEYIGNYAFSGAKSLTSIVIPASVKEIGNYAFFNCSRLQSVVFRGNVTVLGTHAFYGCNMLTFYLADGVDLADSGWNSSFRPLVHGCTLSDDGTFVVSVTTGKIDYPTALIGLSDPVREGFDFVGWATEQGGEAQYQTGELAGLPAGQTLYAVYRFHVEEEAPGETQPSEE